MTPTKANKKPSANGAPEAKTSPSGALAAKSNVAAKKEAPAAAPLPKKEAPVVHSANEDGEAKKERAPSAVQTLANELIASNDAQAVLRHAVALEDDREATANQA
ncbi:MAG TPA: hypothetical protein VI299_21240, partial [Polyangiales bacterium]